MANDRLSMNPTQRWTLAVTSVAALLIGLDALVVSTALTTIRTDLGASVEELEWTVNAYVLSFAVLLMTAAALGDRWGRRRMFTVGLGLFAAASLGCALAPDASWLIAARTAQGAGAALLMPLALALLSEAFPATMRPKALGIFTGVVGASVPLGPLLGGAIVEGVSWPWIFWLNLPIALALIPLTLTKARESHGPSARLDLLGLVLVSGASFGIVWGLVRGNSAGWSSLEVLAALILGGVLSVAFVLWELRTRAPMLPMRLFRSRRFAAGNAAIFLVWGSTLGALFFMAQFLQTGLGYGPLAAGVALMPWGATTVVVPQITGSLIHRLGERPFVVAGTLLNAASMGWIAVVAESDLVYWQLVPAFIVGGAGIAMSILAAQSAVMTSIAGPDIGKAAGAFSTIRQLGGAFGVAVPVAMFAATGSYESTPAFIDGFGAAVGACAALSAVGVIAGLAIPARRRAIDATGAASEAEPVGVGSSRPDKSGANRLPDGRRS